MKAVAVSPGKAGSVHLVDVAKPSVDDVANGRGVLVKVLRVGVDGTDKEINDALYGQAPPGSDFLIIGHESLGVVEAVGGNVTELEPGDYVVATVRRPGSSLYDRIGMSDMTTDDTYFERGINLRHGFLTEYYVDEPEYVVRVPMALNDVGVLLEPTSIVEKGIAQAYEIQRRLRVWRPRRAAVLGANALGLLATLMLRLRGLDVVTMARTRPPYLNAALIGEIGGRYVSTRDRTLAQASDEYGPFDIILEGTGFSPLAFEAMEVLAKNGVLVLLSVTQGERTVEVPADKINLGFVLGNKVAAGSVNANRDYFERGAVDLSAAELQYPGWLSKLLTHRVVGLDNYEQMMQLLTEEKAIKVFVDVAG
ncbi:MAG: glucose 1-dehydrogenase [Longimicrobiales bacterium]